MTEDPKRFEKLIGQLAREPGLAMLAKPGAAVLVWDRSVETLLWASPAAAKLREIFADESGRVTPDLRARHRLKVLADGLAPRQGARLERIWLDSSRLLPPITCACRLAETEGGAEVLVTGIVGALPKLPARPRNPSSGEPGTNGSAPPPAADTPPKPRSTIRFVWQADPETRFTHVSPELAESVGPRSADILGKSWDEVARSVAEDAGGSISSLFARRQTWRGRTVLWNMDEPGLQVPVDWAGMPVFGADRELAGFRGFGLLRLDAVRERCAAVEDEADGASSHEPHAGQRSSEAHDRSGRPLPPGLSDAERNAFREIARALGSRSEPDPPSLDAVARAMAEEPPGGSGPEKAASPSNSSALTGNGDRVLDRLPIGILVHRGGRPLFANRLLLDLAGYADIGALAAQGGLARLLPEAATLRTGEPNEPSVLVTRGNERLAVDLRVSSADWDGRPADLMTVRPLTDADVRQRLRALEADLSRRESRVRELEAILDTATDGVILLDGTGRILSLNRSAEALFGYDQREVVGEAITVLLAPESHMAALGYLDGLRSPGVQSLLNDGREVQGRVRQGGSIPLFMTLGHVGEGPEWKFCAVLRDMTAFKKAEGELIGAKRAAEEANAQKSDLLARISHEIRTPLNAILGFAEVILEERFGPIGNERYAEYLKDIHASGAHVISLVNDLLDLAKVEAGRMELSFTSVSLNDLVAACVALLQPQAARDRIVMRTSFPEKLPPVVADERSMRQIALNLVSNAIKFTDAGGQVIVSTALTDRGEVAFRVRDTGIGMTEKEIEAALEPFRQLATSRKRGGTGLGLPLTKALVEANRGALQIASHPNEGTLVEVIFPPARVLAE